MRDFAAGAGGGTAGAAATSPPAAVSRDGGTDGKSTAACRAHAKTAATTTRAVTRAHMRTRIAHLQQGSFEPFGSFDSFVVRTNELQDLAMPWTPRRVGWSGRGRMNGY